MTLCNLFPILKNTNRSSLESDEENSKKRITQIALQSLPTLRYLRQAVRNKLDIVGLLKWHLVINLVKPTINFNATILFLPIFRCFSLVVGFRSVVSIGGIMGLFLGFSILSAVELFYFFAIRVCKGTNPN